MEVTRRTFAFLAPASSSILVISAADYFGLVYWASDYKIAGYCLITAVLLVVLSLAYKKAVLKTIAWLFMTYAVAMVLRKNGFLPEKPEIEFIKNALIGTPILWLVSWLCNISKSAQK